MQLNCPYLVVTSDSHCGSTLGLCHPDGVELDDEGSYSASVYQRAIWAQWRLFWDEFVPSVTKGEPYAWLHNGDSIEGQHHRTTQTISGNIEDQIRCAETVLEPEVCKARLFDIVRGTPAHVGESGKDEEALAKALGCEKRNGSHSRWEVNYDLNGYHIHAAHHIGTTMSVAYEHSALSRELMKMLVESAQWGDDHPDLMIRSHRHRYASAAIPTARGTAEILITPAWQLKTGFVWKVNVLSRPQIGGVVIGSDEYGLYHRRFIWAPPKSGTVALTPRAAKQLISTGQHSSKRPATGSQTDRKGSRKRR